MSSFRTVQPYLNWNFQVDYPSGHFMIGSCFSENIGKKLSNARFDCCINPFGILYHPLALSRVLKRLINDESYSDKDLLLKSDRYISFDHHGKFNHKDKDHALSYINKEFNEGRRSLKEADFIYITWGSAFGYISMERNNLLVSNCHKIPSGEFERRKSEQEEIVNEYIDLIELIRKFNPKGKIILSVSPVKHVRDGLIENNRSKATLLLAAASLNDRFEQVYYYPAFELLQDDLRDYRFYAKDMAHPNDQAVDYIWEHFRESLFSKKAKESYKKIISVKSALDHRPLHPEDTSYSSFLKNTLSKIQKLEVEYDFIDYSEEKSLLEKQLKASS